MARDPNRIYNVMAALKDLWADFPDQRFGQLVMNLMRPIEGDPSSDINPFMLTEFLDPWEWEEDEWLRRIAAFREKHGASS